MVSVVSAVPSRYPCISFTFLEDNSLASYLDVSIASSSFWFALVPVYRFLKYSSYTCRDNRSILVVAWMRRPLTFTFLEGSSLTILSFYLSIAWCREPSPCRNCVSSSPMSKYAAYWPACQVLQVFYALLAATWMSCSVLFMSSKGSHVIIWIYRSLVA